MPSLSSRLSSAGVVARGTVAVCVDRPAQVALPVALQAKAARPVLQAPVVSPVKAARPVLQAPVALRAKLARAGWPVLLVLEAKAVRPVLLALRAKAVPGVLLALRAKAVRPVLLQRPGLRAVRSSARAISIGGSPSFNAWLPH
jgi:hypothetical protein